MLGLGLRAADRLLLKLVPQLHASACCSLVGYTYCCSYCGKLDATCVFNCYCNVIQHCYECPS